MSLIAEAIVGVALILFVLMIVEIVLWFIPEKEVEAGEDE